MRKGGVEVCTWREDKKTKREKFREVFMMF